MTHPSCYQGIDYRSNAASRAVNTRIPLARSCRVMKCLLGLLHPGCTFGNSGCSCFYIQDVSSMVGRSRILINPDCVRKLRPLLCCPPNIRRSGGVACTLNAQLEKTEVGTGNVDPGSNGNHQASWSDHTSK